MDELINIPTKAEERSIIQISFRTKDPNIRQAHLRNLRQELQSIIDDPPWIRQSARFTAKIRNPCDFLRPDPSIRKPIHSPPPTPSYRQSLSERSQWGDGFYCRLTVRILVILQSFHYCFQKFFIVVYPGAIIEGGYRKSSGIHTTYPP